MNFVRMRNSCFWATALLLIMLSVTNVFALGTKEKKIAKPNPVINIPDGEFLRYGVYIGGEKLYDVVFLTRIVTDSKGYVTYNIYSEYIPFPPGKDSLPEDYTKWSSLFRIDPQKGVVLEAEMHYSREKDDMEAYARYGMGDILSTHYILYPEKNLVEDTIESIVDNNLNNIRYKTYKVKISPDIPAWESGMCFLYAPRIMDIENGGIIHNISPHFMKDPVPVSYKMGKMETMQTKAGSFRVYRLIASITDPFLGMLLGPFISGDEVGIWVEDSERKVVVKVQRPGVSDISILEELSNINTKVNTK